MDKPIICITAGFTVDPTPAQLLKKSYCSAVEVAGGIPLVVPYTDRENMDCILEIADGIIFSGGGDILPSIYGEEKVVEPVNYFEIRDDFDLEFFKRAYATDIPLMAICRGIQVANVALGGTLWQDIPTQCDPKYPHRQTEARNALTHDVTALPDTRLRQLTGLDTFGVNTFHHQSIKDIAPRLKVSAYSDDGIVEAAEPADDRAFFIGTQWHPEELCEYPFHKNLFIALIEEAKKYRSLRKA